MISFTISTTKQDIYLHLMSKSIIILNCITFFLQPYTYLVVSHITSFKCLWSHQEQILISKRSRCMPYNSMLYILTTPINKHCKRNLIYQQRLRINTITKQAIHFNYYYLTHTKSHSCSSWPQKNVHNFSLEGTTIFLPAPFSYNHPSCNFLSMLNFNPLLHYWVTV